MAVADADGGKGGLPVGMGRLRRLLAVTDGSTQSVLVSVGEHRVNIKATRELLTMGDAKSDPKLTGRR